jgi:AcrR family transcriptional regulator
MKIKAKKTIKLRKPGRPIGDGISQSINRAVIKILASEGYDGLSIESVATEAKVNKTSVYRKWKTKEDLVQAALFIIAQELHAKVIKNDQQLDLKKMAVEIGKFLSSPVGRALFMATIQSSSIKVATTARNMMSHKDSSEKLELTIVAGAIIHRIFIENEPLNTTWIESLVRRLEKM